MHQTKFVIKKSHVKFINNYKTYGFKNKNSMVQEALERFRRELELRNLKRSAELYAELYEVDTGLSDPTESAVMEWPE